MLFLHRIPRLIRWIFSVSLVFMLIMSIGRLIIFWTYNPPGKAFSGSAFILGLRYDARIVGILAVLMLLLCAVKPLNPFKKPAAAAFWNILLPFAFLLLIFFYAVDFYHFDYLHQRLNASVLNYLQDAGISVNMMWQSYPLIKITLVLIILLIGAFLLFRSVLSNYQHQYVFYRRRSIGFYLLTFLFFGFFVFGKLGQFPLRWSDAYTLSDDFKANLALNPFQSFFSTLNFRNSSYDLKKVKESYPLVAEYLGVKNPDNQNLNFTRQFTAAGSNDIKPNVILVICESFSAYKSSMYNNPLNTTPFFDSLSKQGVFFDRCFTPAYGTARGVWATITGIPDVESPKTASRNPNAVDQHTIINDFDGYQNLYFLGGNATWANIRGVLTNNIKDLKLYEQDDYKAAKIDVWGISDKNLFIESNRILAQQTKPFFAIIQTADNHRPYTIPDEDKAVFEMVTFPEDQLKRYGFVSNDEMNAFRYTDFCFRTFMEAAKKEKYFDNSIFVFVGDHGIRYNGKLDYFPEAWTEQGLTTVHVPLLFYAPTLLKPKTVHTVSSQLDILPSVAALANRSYRNTTFGFNLFAGDSAAHQKEYAFIIDHDVHSVGLASENYYYLKNIKSGKEDFVSLMNNVAVPVNPQTDSLKKYLKKLTEAYYESAKYMLLNNKKN